MTPRAGSVIHTLSKDPQDWRSLWEPQVAPIGLEADASPRAALAVIESLREARAQRDEADILHKRIQGINRDTEVFRARVDDILLRFDDARSVATLDVLAEPAERTQVIFFTHHRHMLDLARHTIQGSVLQVHRLLTPSAPVPVAIDNTFRPP